jgi:hypothetical protein
MAERDTLQVTNWPIVSCVCAHVFPVQVPLNPATVQPRPTAIRKMPFLYTDQVRSALVTDDNRPQKHKHLCEAACPALCADNPPLLRLDKVASANNRLIHVMRQRWQRLFVDRIVPRSAYSQAPRPPPPVEMLMKSRRDCRFIRLAIRHRHVLVGHYFCIQMRRSSRQDPHESSSNFYNEGLSPCALSPVRRFSFSQPR